MERLLFLARRCFKAVLVVLCVIAINFALIRAAPGDPATILQAYAQLARQDQLNARAYLQLLPRVMDQVLSLGLWGLRSDNLTLGGLKYFTDGSIQGFTAALREDYHTRPGYRG